MLRLFLRVVWDSSGLCPDYPALPPWGRGCSARPSALFPAVGPWTRGHSARQEAVDLNEAARRPRVLWSGDYIRFIFMTTTKMTEV